MFLALQHLSALLLSLLHLGGTVSVDRVHPFWGPPRRFRSCCSGCDCNGTAPLPEAIPLEVGPGPAPGPAPAPGGPAVHGINPNAGSICGGTQLTVYGSGFSPVPSDVSVQIAGKPCAVTMSSESEIVCTTPAFADKVQSESEAHIAEIVVTVHGFAIPVLDKFSYPAALTPIVSTFGPVSGQGGDLVTFEGVNFGGNLAIQVGGNPCQVKAHSDLFVQCVPTPACTGLADVHFHVEGKGNACPGPKAPIMKFLYSLTILSVRPEQFDAPSMGSFGGGGSLVVVGQGFCPGDTVNLCDGDVTSVCEITSSITDDPPQFHEGDTSFQTFKCRPGPLSDPHNTKLVVTADGPQVGSMNFKKGPAPKTRERTTTTAPPCGAATTTTMSPCISTTTTTTFKEYTKTCQLTVTAAAGALKASIQGAWTYSHRMTPTIAKVLRGNLGVGHIEIYGNGFKEGPDNPDVQVGGAPCAVSGATTEKIDCYDSTAPPAGAVITIHVPGSGDAQPVTAGADVLA